MNKYKSYRIKDYVVRLNLLFFKGAERVTTLTTSICSQVFCPIFQALDPPDYKNGVSAPIIYYIIESGNPCSHVVTCIENEYYSRKKLTTYLTTSDYIDYNLYILYRGDLYNN